MHTVVVALGQQTDGLGEVAILGHPVDVPELRDELAVLAVFGSRVLTLRRRPDPLAEPLGDPGIGVVGDGLVDPPAVVWAGKAQRVRTLDDLLRRELVRVGIQFVVEIGLEDVGIAGQPQERLQRNARVHGVERSRKKLLQRVVPRRVDFELGEPMQRALHPVGGPPCGSPGGALPARVIRHPIWYLNLQANPLAEFQVGSEVRPYKARQVEGEEKADCWRKASAVYPDYDDYQKRTDREIPVLVLEPR